MRNLVTSLPVGTKLVVNGCELFTIAEADTKHVKLQFDLPEGWSGRLDSLTGRFVLTSIPPER